MHAPANEGSWKKNMSGQLYLVYKMKWNERKTCPIILFLINNPICCEWDVLRTDIWSKIVYYSARNHRADTKVNCNNSFPHTDDFVRSKQRKVISVYISIHMVVTGSIVLHCSGAPNGGRLLLQL